jgi:nucleotide-binding universal stress UspA family protein
MRAAAKEAGLPGETTIFWEEGEVADAILHVAHREEMDLLVAGALEKERPLRYYLGSVAHKLAREAPCSLLLITEPREQPEPIRRIVVVTDYSESSQIAMARAIRLASREDAEVIYVIRMVLEHGEAMALSEGFRRERASKIRETTRAEEADLLRNFVDAAGITSVPIQARCIEGPTGQIAARFVREVDGDLLVIPSTSRYSNFFTRLFPAEMEWVLREIPCSLWIARERIVTG